MSLRLHRLSEYLMNKGNKQKSYEWNQLILQKILNFRRMTKFYQLALYQQNQGLPEWQGGLYYY